MSKRNPTPQWQINEQSRWQVTVTRIIGRYLVVAALLGGALCSLPALYQAVSVYCVNVAAIEAQKDFALQMAELQKLGERSKIRGETNKS